jgi:ATP-binding cassette, subfamily B, bacterial
MKGLAAGEAFAVARDAYASAAGGADDGAPLDADAPEALARALRQHGVRARTVRFSRGRGLRHVRLPALVEVEVEAEERRWLLIERWRGARALVRGGGQRLVPRRAVRAAATGSGIEITPAATGGVLRSRLGLALPRTGRRLGLLLAVVLALQILALALPLLIRVAVDQALSGREPGLLALVAAAIAAIALYQAGLGWLKDSTVLSLRSEVEVRLVADVLLHVLRLPLAWVQKRTSGELLEVFTGLQAAIEVLGERLLGLLLEAPLLLLYLLAIAWLSGAVGAAALAAVLLLLAVTAALGKAQAPLYSVEIASRSRQRSTLLEALRGIETVKSAGLEGTVVAAWGAEFRRELQAGQRRGVIALRDEVLEDGLRYGLLAFAVAWGAARAAAGTLSVGAFVQLAQLTAGFTAALAAVNRVLAVMMLLPSRTARTTECLAVPEVPPRGRRAPGRQAAGAIVLDDVWFRYDEERPWVLRGETLRIEPGAKHWLRAPSGSGKTTMLRLVAGLYDPDRGRVTIGGLPPAALSDDIAYLPQDIRLHSGTLLRNLQWLSMGAPKKRLAEAAEASGLAAWVRTLPMGYDTVIAVDVGLSGGQKQLVALTAVMAADRRVLLLDEAFANLDWVSRSWISSSDWFADKTVLYASHDGGL